MGETRVGISYGPSPIEGNDYLSIEGHSDRAGVSLDGRGSFLLKGAVSSFSSSLRAAVLAIHPHFSSFLLLFLSSSSLFLPEGNVGLKMVLRERGKEKRKRVGFINGKENGRGMKRMKRNSSIREMESSNILQFVEDISRSVEVCRYIIDSDAFEVETS